MSETIVRDRSIPRGMPMKAFHKALPLWVRAALLAGVLCLVAGAGLVSYRFYVRPATLTIAVGSFDGEAKQTAAIIAGRLATTAPLGCRTAGLRARMDHAAAGDHRADPATRHSVRCHGIPHNSRPQGSGAARPCSCVQIRSSGPDRWRSPRPASPSPEPHVEYGHRGANRSRA